MGCQGSRCWAGEPTDIPEAEELREEEAEEFLMDEVRCPDPMDGGACDPPAAAASRLVLDLAQRMSEDVVAEALQLCWLVEERHKELPFIDSEWDYVI